MRSRIAWILALVGLFAGCRAREAAPAATAVPPAVASPSAAAATAAVAAPTVSAESAAPSPEKLIGRWLRSDKDYTIEIAGVLPDGKLDARYFNPGPIHVSRAETATQDGKLLMALELTDKNYPGNFYALVYDPGSDALVGVYNHLGINQQFEVVFSRVSPKP